MCCSDNEVLSTYLEITE